MTGGVQQLLTVMLSVDVQQLPAQYPELRHRHGTPIEPAHVPTVCQDLPLDEHLPILIRTYPVLCKPRECRQLGELCAHHRALCSGAD